MKNTCLAVRQALGERTRLFNSYLCRKVTLSAYEEDSYKLICVAITENSFKCQLALLTSFASSTFGRTGHVHCCNIGKYRLTQNFVV